MSFSVLKTSLPLFPTFFFLKELIKHKCIENVEESSSKYKYSKTGGVRGAMGGGGGAESIPSGR